MKNLREFFCLYKPCPLCGSDGKDLHIYYSRYPKGKLLFSINKTLIHLSLEDEYNMSINLDSNCVDFSENSFGTLSGGDYIFNLTCSQCQGLRCEAYTYYRGSKIAPLEMLNERVKLSDEDNTYEYIANHLNGDSKLVVLRSDAAKFKQHAVMMPLITLAALPLYDRDKLLTKFKNMLLLSP